MSENMSVETLIMLLGLVTTLIAIVSPILKLTKTMAELTLTVQALKDSLNDIIVKNHDAHRQMWEHNNKQDEIINDHDRRISRIENKMEISQEGNKRYGTLNTSERMFDES